MQFYKWAAAASCVWAPAAHAGETPIYAPAPSWVTQADAATAIAKGKGRLVIYDKQIHVEGASETTYSDIAMRLDSPQSLTQNATLTLTWMPDKGDLIVHRVQLLRDGAVIDVLKDAKFEVLRREQQLEQRELNGMLTATLQVAGARVGDVLRVSSSATVSDKALGGNVQAVELMPYFADQPGLGRMIARWPAARAITATAGPRALLPPSRVAGADRTLAIDLPRPKPIEMPADSPARFRMPEVLRITSFADWPDVSRTMAPLFATAGTIAKDGPIAAEVARIAAAGTDPVARMTSALILVQDRIAYFANGMNGGNYVPQSPAKTWTSRQGDCKAKTLLLLAMLRELGINGDALLVNATTGDAVPEWGPMPGAFNHVIVHATIAGRDYWLDGTGVGTRQASIADVPPFRWGLPLRAEGSQLIALPATAPTKPWMTTTIIFDQTFGIDMPMLFDARFAFAGPIGAPVQQLAAAPAGHDRNDAIDMVVSKLLDNDPVIYERTIAYDTATGIGLIIAKGLATTPWDTSSKRPVYVPKLPSSGASFSADRSRASWHDIPTIVDGPSRVRAEYTVLLPDGGKGATIEGGAVHLTAASGTVDRETTLVGNKLTITEDLASPGGELRADAIAAERAKLTELSGSALRVRGGTGGRRSWDVRTAADRRALRPIEAAYAQAIAQAKEADKAQSYVNRSLFLRGIGDRQGALNDMNAAITLDGTADNLTTRADLYIDTGDLPHALADLRAAQALDSSPARAAGVAMLLGLQGHADQGLALLDPFSDTQGDDRPKVVSTRADLLSEQGRKAEGAKLLDTLLGERPGDAEVLNAACWYHGSWNYDVAAAALQCDQALRSSDYAASVLDSRAMVNFRLGKLDAARADADAALDRNPRLAPTLLLRGAIKRKAGDAAGGAADIAEALRRSPGLAYRYRSFGVLP